jgi:ElaB/YqjD/DUF883 family membrane-anchored ribosome-binding protein
MTANQPSNTAGARSTSNSGRSDTTFDTLADESARIVDDARDLGRRAVSAASSAAQTLRTEGSAALAASRKKVEQAKGRFDDLVSDNPTTAVLIAVGVGAAIGFAIGRIRR